MRMSTAAYLRVSTGRQSIDQQRDAVVGGWHNSRPGFPATLILDAGCDVTVPFGGVQRALLDRLHRNRTRYVGAASYDPGMERVDETASRPRASASLDRAAR